MILLFTTVYFGKSFPFCALSARRFFICALSVPLFAVCPPCKASVSICPRSIPLRTLERPLSIKIIALPATILDCPRSVRLLIVCVSTPIVGFGTGLSLESESPETSSAVITCESCTSSYSISSTSDFSSAAANSAL